MNNRQNKSLLSYALYIFSLLIFGTNGLLVSRISIESSQIVLMRTLIGGISLTGLVFLRGGFDIESLHHDRVCLIIGGIALGLNWVALFTAYRLLNVSLATLVYYVGPIIVLLLSPVLLHEKLTGRKAIAAVLVAAGLICISGSIVLTSLNYAGLLTAILSAFFYATLIAFNKRITCTNGMQTAAIELDVAFAVVLVYVLCTAGLPHITKSDLPYIAVIGFVNTGLAYFLYFAGMQKLSVQSVALISYLDPVSALIFSALLLHEAMSPVQMLGAVLIIGGAMFGELKQKSASPV